MAEEKQMAFDDMLDDQAELARTESEEGTSIEIFSAGPPKLTAEDIIIPRLTLGQGLSQAVSNGQARPGQWLLTGVPPLDSVEATVVAIAKFRRMNNDEDGAVVCRSEDAITGVGDPGGDCASCPFSKWVNATDNKSKSQPPKCSYGYRYLLDIDGYGQAIYEMKRTALPAAKALNGMVVRGGYGTTRIKLTSAKAQGGKGTYYIPVVSPL